MRIAGLDLSPTGSGICALELDDGFGIVSCNFLGFTDVKKNAREDRSLYYRNEDFQSNFARTAWMQGEIMKRLDNVSAVAVENFAYTALGKIADIGMFAGVILQSVYERGISIRMYTPQAGKKHFTGRGDADKIGMYEAFLAREGVKPDLSDYPVPKSHKGVKPTSDIIDAYALADTLRTELLLRSNPDAFATLPKCDKEIFRIRKDGKGLLQIPLASKFDCYLT